MIFASAERWFGILAIDGQMAFIILMDEGPKRNVSSNMVKSYLIHALGAVI